MGRNRFGSFGTGRGPEGIVPYPPVTQEDMPDDIRQIREKYIPPVVYDPRPFNLTANAGIRFEMSATRVNAFVVTVTTGLAFIYIGEFSNQFGMAAPTPHFAVSAGVVPVSVQFAIPDSDEYVFCVQDGGGATCTGCIIPMAL